jgi:hypothetical protein
VAGGCFSALFGAPLPHTKSPHGCRIKGPRRPCQSPSISRAQYPEPCPGECLAARAVAPTLAAADHVHGAARTRTESDKGDVHWAASRVWTVRAPRRECRREPTVPGGASAGRPGAVSPAFRNDWLWRVSWIVMPGTVWRGCQAARPNGLPGAQPGDRCVPKPASSRTPRTAPSAAAEVRDTARPPLDTPRSRTGRALSLLTPPGTVKAPGLECAAWSARRAR